MMEIGGQLEEIPMEDDQQKVENRKNSAMNFGEDDNDTILNYVQDSSDTAMNCMENGSDSVMNSALSSKQLGFAAQTIVESIPPKSLIPGVKNFMTNCDAFGFDSQCETSEALLDNMATYEQAQEKILAYFKTEESASNELDKRNQVVYEQAVSEVESPKMIQERRRSLERLLGLLYEGDKRRYSMESDFTTDTSHFSDCSQQTVRKFSADYLWRMDLSNLKMVLMEMKEEVNYANNKLIRASKQRAHQLTKQQAKCNIITAVLQAMSEKREVDAKLQFSLKPPSSENGFCEWTNAMKAVARLPNGIPHYFRGKVWTTLANHFIKELGIDWKEISRIAFNDKINPGDDRLSLQIIKDLHRTGWSGIKGDDGKFHLKRVLLGYARFNKVVGYCQGFNVIAALVLEVMDYEEEMTLKIMIFLIEHVLPRGYFDRSLHALSVDMAVLKDLLYQRLPKTAKHFDDLQRSSQSEFEPPLTNVFSMQWFLTLFATCLPKSCLYRIWDALMLEGSEVLLRTSLVIWAKFSSKILKTTTADEFYSLMGSSMCRNIMQMRSSEIDDFIGIIYTMSIFPYPGISELRERYTYNIQPFTPSYSLFQHQVNNILHMSEDEDAETNSASCIGCGTEISATKADLAKLQKQYELLKKRQKQAAIIFHSATCEQNLVQNFEKKKLCEFVCQKIPDDKAVPVFNHLFLSVMLTHLRNNASEKSPLYLTLCGAVPVASQVIQPFNEDSMKAQITLSNDGQSCFMVTSSQRDGCNSSKQNIIRCAGKQGYKPVGVCVGSGGCNHVEGANITCTGANSSFCYSNQDQFRCHVAENSDRTALFSTVHTSTYEKGVVIDIGDDSVDESYLTNKLPTTAGNVKNVEEIQPFSATCRMDVASRANMKRSRSMIGNMVRQPSHASLPPNPFPTVHRSSLFRDGSYTTL